MIKTKKQAIMALSDVEPRFVFWLCDGTTLKNLDELLESLNYMSRETFHYHVNKKKNDFAKWINDIIKDEKLANNLYKVKTKKETIDILKARVVWLKVKAGLLDKSELITKKKRTRRTLKKRAKRTSKSNMAKKEIDKPQEKSEQDKQTLLNLL